ncbi:MAG TPA: (2Fe-2S)-binding protein [Candidatus Binataceae bacterium]|nr:(2Fe-2S)-binding protein [Candidatus Binataceae bacterium]
MSTTHHLRINENAYEVVVDHYDTPLLYVLRDNLGLKGTKFGCGNGQCGSCTVLVDGRAAKSCELPAWSMEGKSITTIEGLGTIDHLHPLQQAILDFQAGQCGYCLSGIIMTAAELIQSDPHPSRDKVVAKLAANLCRCGAHTRIVKAIESAWRKAAPGAAQ